ncbi:MAG: phosphodiester glycosidase family protein [Clostridiales bacterium]|nr:phosphodiester glycosidase family protein [Clostridiales bacterium]
MNRRQKALLLGLLLAAGLLPAAAETSAPAATLVPPSRQLITPTPAPTAQRDLVVGDRGDDVYALKARIQELGYFNAETALSAIVSEVTLERVNLLLSDNGMGPVEVITAEIQDMILSRDDLALNYTPGPTPQPLLASVGTPKLPQLDAEGFLPDADGEFVFADAEDGLWYYISDTLYINIRRYNDLEEENIWCEAEIKTRGGERLLSFLHDTLYTYERPVTTARENDAVLAFTDDYFSFRKYGVAIRDREVYRDYIRKSSEAYPLGDTLAVFADGSMLASEYSAYTAWEFLTMDAVHVLSFGPWLLSGGEINPRLLTGEYMHYHEPRCALGMIAPGHYVVITVDGRYDGARGAYIEWLALRMQEIGVTEAVNLDGGGTTAMVFMGLQISRVASAKPSGAYTRKVTSMLGFGTSEAVADLDD